MKIQSVWTCAVAVTVSTIAIGCSAEADETGSGESEVISSTSAYTSLEGADCGAQSFDGVTTGGCVGMKDYQALRYRNDGGKTTVEVLRNGHPFEIDLRSVPFFGSASRLGAKAEWRGVGLAIGQVDPYALILRYFTTTPGGGETNHMVVTRLEADGICVLGTVSGAEPNHNEKARQIADANRSTRCPRRCGALRADEVLNAGESVTSCGNAYSLTMQGDGNLVLYQAATGRAVWHSQTHGTDARTAVMQGDGNLVVYGAAGAPRWSSNTHGHGGAWLNVDDWGGMYVENPANYGAPFWWAPTDGPGE